MKHEARSKADGSPLCQILINSGGALGELLPRTIQFAVVSKIMDAHLESMCHEKFTQRLGSLVVPFRDEIEGGAEPQAHLHFCQIMTSTPTLLSFNVMSKDECKLLAFRPAAPPVRFSTGELGDGP